MYEPLLHSSDRGDRKVSIRKLCLAPSCSRFREEGSKYCSKHREQYESADRQRYVDYLNRRYQHTQSRANDFYRSPEWRKLSRRLLKERPVCEVCGMNYSADVHHRFPVADYPEMALDEDNLMCLCKSCHARITDEERKLRRESNG